MLVRVTSGADGIKEYLEEGRKKGREFHRELIDERITLDGDIDLMDSVIESMETLDPDASRYLHITLGFAEEFTHGHAGHGQINQAIIQAVQDRFKAHLMAAYDQSEFVWYSEAHIPKVSHDINATTGAYEERRPHIHIVIPMLNLMDGKYLNPLGFGKANIKYLDAIQEQINAEFGLKSPKDSLREKPYAGGMHPLHKHNPEFNEQTPTAIRAAVKEAIESGQVGSFNELKEFLATWGEVRVRNGKDGQYLNVKPSWAAKGINLKDHTPEKILVASSLVKVKGHSHPDASDRNGNNNRLVSEWKTQASLQARFITSGNRHVFKALDAAGQAEMLARLHQDAMNRLDYTPLDNAKFAVMAAGKKIEELSMESARRVGRRTGIKQTLNRMKGLFNGNKSPGADHGITGNDRWPASGADGKTHRADRHGRPTKPDYRQSRQGAPAKSLDSLPNLSSSVMAHYNGIAMLLPGNARHDVDGNIAIGADGLRRDIPARGRGRGIDALKRLVTRTALEQKLKVLEAPQALSADQLKNDTNPLLVIELAARIYKIDPSAYSVSNAADGSPRIRHENRSYNLGDFFTKHLGKTWAEAQEQLTVAYYNTMAGALPEPNAALWAGFNSWRIARNRSQAVERKEIREAWRKERTNVRNHYKAEKARIGQLRPAVRHNAMRVLRAERLIKETRARQNAQAGLAGAAHINRNAEYRIYLQDCAQKGDLAALRELRNCAPEGDDKFQQGNSLTGEKAAPVFPLPDYKVDAAGRVLYLLHDNAVVADTMKSVNILKADREAYDLAIKVAVAKYGKTITLNGDEKFISGMIEAAKRSGLELQIARSDQPRSKPVEVLPIKKQKR